ncbi:non-hydrolyzing UDP-N-acetylglucosamine 2-epimerase [Luteococcus sanguinis]|uniref:UDP-N-acetylglucosamine 2-epimerase (non-hydrolyzing) n=1 Tax=Luteococcus sanguinis TaxID=174038 RepID=A0ABW1X2D6_9ACTN
MTTTVLAVYGTRPEAIKMAPVIKALETSETLHCEIAVTGQHREMLDQVNEMFGIVPDHDLNVFEPGQTLNALMAKVFARIDPVLEQVAPKAVLVQGDTSTVAAAAIAAMYRQIPVVHLEAGLRSGDIWSPFPEEANRKIVSQITSLHLAPTTQSRDNLLREGISADDIVVTGNTVIDALFTTLDLNPPVSHPQVAELVEQGKKILLVTTHRRENWGGAMENVGRALRTIAQNYPEMTIVLPAHRNPLVREAVLPSVEGLPNVLVTEPLSYGEFIRVMNAAHIVLTDSGGVQEEAPSLGRPVLVMRENTERPEAVAAGTVRLIGTDEARIVDEVSRLMTSQASYDAMSKAQNPYGDGQAASRTVAAIEQLLGLGQRIEDFSVDRPAPRTVNVEGSASLRGEH